MAGQLYLT
ncbi:hypothetical protein F383_27525 [Gossypium arboreum]|uniref:Uncharacterized protein n=1 Tax=Gossypium arboreum TaxID=29729 RepID=A0A0B0PFI2_GOSAR|nr:hypothetical protein F383_27525 [Gossypium arboreum]